MDKDEKLAVARKKLRKFQARTPAKKKPEKTESVAEGRAVLSNTSLMSSASLPLTSNSPTPPQARLSSSTQGLREISQEISNLLSQSTLPRQPASATPTVHTPSHSIVPGHIPSHGSLSGHIPSQDALLSSRNSLLGTPSSSPQYPTTLRTAHESSQVPLASTTAGPPLTFGPSRDTATSKQVQLHAQTIDILVGEKSNLQSQLTELQGHLRNKNREVSDLGSHLHATRQKLEEIEREKLTMSEEAAGREKALSQSVQECQTLRQTVERLQLSLEEQRQEGTELISKVTSQAAHIQRLQAENTELQGQLNMAELLTQQLSAGTPTIAPPSNDHTPSTSEVEELRGELEVVRGSLRQVMEERNQALSDLTALREAMLHQQEEGTRRLAELQGHLAESEVQVSNLSEELAALQQERESVVERVSAEQAQLQQSNHVAMGTLQQERDKLNRDLQQQVQDNANLTRLNTAQEEHLASLEDQLRRLQEGAVDQQALLATISQDKETISRAVSQNKELKSQLGELQDAFVHLSQQNMELASDLQTARHRCGQLERLLQEAQDTHTDSRTHVEAEVEMAHSGAESAVAHSANDDGEQAELLMQTTPPFPTVEPSTAAGEPPAVDEPEPEGQGEQEDNGRVAGVTGERGEDNGRAAGVTGERGEDNGRAAGVTGERDLIGREVESRLSTEELTTLQHNFSALQQRFMAVISEKAELVELLQEREHVIVQLAGETETIGEYIALYQTQREALREKFQEKDTFIQHLVVDRTALQAKLHDLQALVRQLLAERRPVTPSHSTQHHLYTSTQNTVHTSSQNTVHTSAQNTIHTGTQDTIHTGTQDTIHTGTQAAFHTSIPLHLRPQVYSSAPPGEREQSGFLSVRENVQEESGSGGRDTAEQIMALLGQLERGSGAEAAAMPCPCCTGQLIVV